jgi:PQQ-dependent catabolism-associated beta-propeller protein
MQVHTRAGPVQLTLFLRYWSQPLACTVMTQGISLGRALCAKRFNTPFLIQRDRAMFLYPLHSLCPLLRGVLLATAMGAAVAVTHAQSPGKVYVSSEKDHKIYVFNASGERQGAIDVCKRPRDMSFSRDARQILVICGDSNAMGVVDLATGKLSGTVPLGDSPEMFALSPDGKTAYVSIEDENTLAAYDLASKQAQFAIKTGGEPEGVLVTPDGKTAYVTSEVANVVHVIDLGARKISQNIPVGKRPRRFVLTPDGSELWVSNELDATLSVVDTKTHTEKQKIRFEVKGMRTTDITPVGMVISPDGQRIWVGLGKANHVAEVDVASKAVKNQVLVGKRAWGMRFHPDGKTLYVANGLSDDMTLVDALNAKAIRTVPAGRVPHSILVAP